MYVKIKKIGQKIEMYMNNLCQLIMIDLQNFESC